VDAIVANLVEKSTTIIGRAIWTSGVLPQIAQLHADGVFVHLRYLKPDRFALGTRRAV
jgi:hypothetical protein